VAVTAVAGITQAVGGAQEAAAQNRMLEYNASVDRQNASLQDQAASYTRFQAERNAAKERVKTGLLIGAQRAKMGGSGALVDSGSFLDVTMDTAEQGAYDAMAIMQQGDVEAWRHEVQAQQYREKATMTLKSKSNPNQVLALGLLGAAAKTTGVAAGMGMFGGAGAAATPSYTSWMPDSATTGMNGLTFRTSFV
jgi:hypothetical protein